MKKATIVVSLIEECNNVANREIEKEILKEFSTWIYLIPWGNTLGNVTVREQKTATRKTS